MGTYLAWGVNNNGWWGEGEIKFYMDGDTSSPPSAARAPRTISAAPMTSTPRRRTDRSSIVSSRRPTRIGPGHPRRRALPGPAEVRPLPLGTSWTPSASKIDLKVTIQALGWRSGKRYLPLQDDIASAAFWYQAEPHAKFPSLPVATGWVI